MAQGRLPSPTVSNKLVKSVQLMKHIPKNKVVPSPLIDSLKKCLVYKLNTYFDCSGNNVVTHLLYRWRYRCYGEDNIRRWWFDTFNNQFLGNKGLPQQG